MAKLLLQNEFSLALSQTRLESCVLNPSSNGRQPQLVPEAFDGSSSGSSSLERTIPNNGTSWLLTSRVPQCSFGCCAAASTVAAQSVRVSLLQMCCSFDEH